MVNSTLNALADGGDVSIGLADYVADAAMALTACAIGDGYCTAALSDLAEKNQAIADTVNGLINGDTWEGIKALAQKANEGDQLALEGMGSLMAAVIIPGKKLPNFGSATSRYPKQYEQYSKLPSKNLEKAISKHEKQISEHKSYLDDPVKRQEHVLNWDNLSPQHQESLLHHWQQDIKRHEAYKSIAEGILKGCN